MPGSVTAAGCIVIARPSGVRVVVNRCASAGSSRTCRMSLIAAHGIVAAVSAAATSRVGWTFVMAVTSLRNCTRAPRRPAFVERAGRASGANIAVSVSRFHCTSDPTAR